MRIWVLCAIIPALFATGRAQITTNCLEVERILVDACDPGSQEGRNEMVQILTGPNPITINLLNISWPNNAYNGFVQNATTASTTAALNASIQSCGYLLQPSGGIIPANKKAILVTSYLMSPVSNSFAGLTDTMYILYQNSTTNTGHFANQGSGTRTLDISYGACTESVTYDRAQLFGGDGASVSFTQAGFASYYNNGCTAPITPTTITASGPANSVCPGATVNLSSVINGNATLIGWSGGTGTFSAAGNANTSYTLGAGETFPLHLIVSANASCGGAPNIISDTVTLSLTPQQPFNITPAGPLSICPGQSITLNVSAGNYTLGPAWSNGTIGTSTTVSTAGTYTAGATDACYTYTTSVTVTAAQAPSVTVTPANGSICNGQNLTISASNVNGTLQWSNGSSNSSITVNAPGTYTATATNSCGSVSASSVITLSNPPSVNITPTATEICAGQSVTLNTSNVSGTLQWGNGATTPSITVNAAGSYSVTATNSCGSVTATQVITAGTAPAVTVNPVSTSICPGTGTTINATGVSGTLTWSNGATGNSISVNAAGSYTATATTGCGTATATATVTLDPLPALSVAGGSVQSFCSGGSITLNATVSDATSFNWNGTSPATSFTVSTAGTYVATASNNCGSVTATVTVNEIPAPSAQISPNGSTTLCNGQSLTLTASGGDTYSWNNGSTGASITVTAAGTYQVISGNSCGSDTAFITVNFGGPDASFSYSGETISPANIAFNNSSSGAVSYDWSFGDGGSSADLNPNYVYQGEGNFTITLTVTDANGCTDQAQQTIQISDPFNFYLPNVFTPNNDSVNDRFLIMASGIKEFRMSIFNRWGELIFESFDVYEGWDGTTRSGANAVSGVYVVVVNYSISSSGKKETKNGSVTLLR